MIDQSYMRQALDVCLALEPHARRAPRPYQLEAIAWAIRGSCLLALDMGLGKTYCALAAWKAIAPKKVALVVPFSTKSVWLEELHTLFGAVEILELLGSKNLRAQKLSLNVPSKKVSFSEMNEQDSSVYLLSHEVVAAYGPVIQARASKGVLFTRARVDKALMASGFLDAPDMVIVDESHLFGNHKSSRTRGLYGLVSKAHRVILLSGTPVMGGIERLFPQLQVIAPRDRWGTYWDFVIRYAGGEENQWGGVSPTKATNISELKERTSKLILSRTKEEVSSSLPKHILQRYVVFLSEKLYREVSSEVEEFSKLLQDRKDIKGDKFLQGEVTRIMGKLAEYKIPDVYTFLSQSLPDKRVLVWCWHRKVAKAIQDLFQTTRTCYRVDGSLSETETNSAIANWADSENGVLVATIAKLGTGFDKLAKYCQNQLVVELPWLPEILEQALARLVRLSQKEKVVHTWLFQLQVPFEKSLCDRILNRANETDFLMGTRIESRLESLFGRAKFSEALLEDLFRNDNGEA